MKMLNICVPRCRSIAGTSRMMRWEVNSCFPSLEANKEMIFKLVADLQRPF